MAETTWLLDVDGVLNAGKPGWSAAPRKGTAFTYSDPWTIRWAPALIARVREIHKMGLVDIVWCTTWCPWAEQIEGLMGLPELARAWCADLRGSYAVEAKRNAARDVLAAGKRLVWTDDDAFPHDRSVFTPDRALLIAPRPSRGLQPDDMDAIEAFVKDAVVEPAA